MWEQPQPFSLRPGTAGDVPAIAGLFARVRRARLPYLPTLHTAEDDRRFFGGHVLTTCTVWVAEADALLGFIAFRAGWVDHLYVEVAHDRRGIGSALIGKAMAVNRELRLWAFQKNTAALCFYRRQGFLIIKETDGSDNEEREPDVLLAWGKGDSLAV